MKHTEANIQNKRKKVILSNKQENLSNGWKKNKEQLERNIEDVKTNDHLL